MQTMDTERITIQEYHDRIGNVIRAFGREPYPGEVEEAVAKAVAIGQTNVVLDEGGNSFVEVPIRR